MAGVEHTYEANHRRQKQVALALSAVALLASLAPRYERALFINGDTDLRALAARVPVEPSVVTFLPMGDGTLFDSPGARTPRAFLARGPRGPAGATPFDAPLPGSGVASPDTAAPLAGLGGGEQPVGAAPALPALVDSAGGSPFPFIPVGISAPSTGPADAGSTSTGGTLPPGTTTTGGTLPPTTTTGGTTTTTGGTTTTTGGTTPIVPAVPEPSTWATLLADS